MFVTSEQYFGRWGDHPDATREVRRNATVLLARVNTLLARAQREGVTLDSNPATGSIVSGSQYGGFRPKSCPEGAPRSAHKQGMGVDLFDPDGDIDDWIMANQQVLTELGLCIEHPACTRGWCHISTRLPKSQRRIFYP